jgi:hypothetical protein
VDFDLTRNTIINDALIHIGALDAGDSPSAADSAFAARQLNRMVKAWQGAGFRLWTRREAYLFLSKSQGRYKLGPNSTDHAAELEDAVFTTLSADAAAGASSVSVASTTGMAAADNIGVVLDDGTIDWDTISAIPGAVTLTGTLSGAASSGNMVFAYTAALNRPLRVLDAQRRDSSGSETPMIMVAHETYQQIPNKTDTGKTNQVYYQPEIPDGFVYLWPEPETSADALRITCLFPIEDFDASSNNPDLPQEWLDALTWNLAKQLMPSYATPADVAGLVREEAAIAYAVVSAWDRETAPTTFEPDFQGWG